MLRDQRDLPSNGREMRADNAIRVDEHAVVECCDVGGRKEQGVADAERRRRTREQLPADNQFAGHERSIAALQILDNPALLLEGHTAMMPRRAAIIQGNIGLTPKNDRLLQSDDAALGALRRPDLDQARSVRLWSLALNGSFLRL